MEAQGNEALTSQLFSESRDVRRHTLPVIYRKRYVGQPAFESRTPVRSRTESRRSDISAINERGRLSRVTEGIVEAPILEQATVEDVKDDAKQSTKLDKMKDDYNNLLLELRSLNLQEKPTSSKGLTIKVTVILTLVAFFLGYYFG
eukprot:TRINITY_DN4296_c0_g1_i9.p1 TRINITY_DN4296_c0_g1~~TRINITY_DN4296_c0_g1_i9.p1  ORF type:complete len:146 (+),score=31.25 TRINITY_DN4296_c0_g1_i9:404-841(+)